MAKIDVYLRSIERFGAAGAVLTSGQSVMLRFPTGDRHATQVTPHDALVVMVREVAPGPALAAIDASRPARFDIESNGVAYSLAVTPKPNAWQVAIEPAVVEAAAPVAAAAIRPARVATAPSPGDAGELAIERGQYDDAAEPIAATAASGSVLLDQLTQAARASRATDVYLSAGASPTMRVAGELRSMGERPAIDAETMSRELGTVAPADARNAWLEHGVATFTYGDGAGRVRATLVRDHRGPGAALRLLVAEPLPLDRLGMPRDVTAWLDRKGLVLVAGASGAGKTTALAAIVHALGERSRRIASFEVAIEIVHASPAISQRRVGDDVHSIEAGIAGAMLEGADTIVIGAVDGAATAGAIVDAVAAGHLVIATISTAARDAEAHLIELVAADRRDLARTVIERGFLGAIGIVAKAGGRSYEVVAGRER
jgi:Tfp pilus assembly pilus retraction ATPase PilT